MKNNIRVAVCISGTISHSLNPELKHTTNENSFSDNIKRLKSKLPGADFYYATWKQNESIFKTFFPEEECLYFTEPDVHYHPYIDIPKEKHISVHYQKQVNWVKSGGEKRIEWLSHCTKQILIHSWLSDIVKDKYDVIIRARYDGYISQEADFLPYIEDTFKNHRANCFTATSQSLFNTLREINSTDVNARHHYWLMDNIIIHNADAIDVNIINLYHKNKVLHGSEFGWYQAISMEHGSKHRNYSGWICPDNRILEEFLWKI